MELFQVVWNDHKHLNLEFRIDEQQDQELNSESVQRLNLKYEIVKYNSPHQDYKEYPSLISVKDFKISKDRIILPLDLHQLKDTEDLQIDLLELRVYFDTGDSITYRIGKAYELADICYNDDIYEDIALEGDTLLTQKKVFAQSETNLEKKTETKTLVYQRNQAKLTRNNSEIKSLLKKNNEKLTRLDESIRELTQTIKNVGLNGISPHNQAISALPPPPPSLKKPRMSDEKPIVRIKKPAPKLKASSGSKLLFIGELKSIIQSSKKGKEEFDFRDILKPMSEDELQKITLDEEELNRRELDFISKKIAKEEAH